MDRSNTKGIAMNNTAKVEEERRFDWPVCYEAEALLLEQIDGVLKRNSFARNLAERLRRETGTLVLDWTDHLVVAPHNEAGFRAAGFVDHPRAEAPKNQVVLYHPHAMLPRVVMAGRRSKVNCGVQKQLLATITAASTSRILDLTESGR